MLPNKLAETYRSVFGSYVFRFISAYAFWLSISVFLLLGVIYSIYSYDIYTDIDDNLLDQRTALSQRYSAAGLEGLQLYSREQRADISTPRVFYSVVNTDQRVIAGDLGLMEGLVPFEFSWLGIQFKTLPRTRTGEYRLAVTEVELHDGKLLQVAESLMPAQDKIELMFDLLLRGTLVTIFLGVIGGAVISMMLLRRVEAFNATISRILGGDLSVRLPINRYSGDFREMEINLNELLERLQELMAGVRRVSDNIAHDLRTPLTRLRNHVAQLEERGNPENADLIESLTKEADELLTTFNAALKIAQIETGNLRSSFKEHDLCLTILDVVELYEPVAMDKGINITQHLPPKLMLKGDRDLLFQVVANLIDNAIKYTGDNGLIEVVLEPGNDQVVLQVRDNGIGIPEEDRHRVFERFFRVETSRSEYPGNGLGLSLVAAAVKHHKGSIRLLDNSPGLCVALDLPA